MITNDICKVCDNRCCIGCKSHDINDGCKLSYNERPLSCQLYPFVVCNSELFLSPICPGMMLFWEKYLEAKELVNVVK